VRDKQDGFDFLRKGFDLLTMRVRGQKTRGTRTRRWRERRRRGEHVRKERCGNFGYDMTSNSGR